MRFYDEWYLLIDENILNRFYLKVKNGVIFSNFYKLNYIVIVIS